MVSKKIAIVGNGGEWSTLPAIRELGKRGCKLYALFQDLNNPAMSSKYLSGYFRLPENIDESIVKVIIHVCKIWKISHLIVFHEDIKYFIIQNRKRLGKIKFASPPMESYKIALRKNRATSFVQSLGIPVPRTIKPRDKSELIDIEHDFRTKLVIRGERGNSSLHVRYAKNKQELESLFDEVVKLEKDISTSSSLPMVQEFIGGPTYLTQAIAQNGKVKIVIPHYKFREWPISGGISSRAKTILEPRLVNYMTTILESLNWNGEAGMEWKYSKEKDDFYFIEMNPRFEGSLDLAVKSGANLPILLLDVMDAKVIPDNMGYLPSIHYRWFFRYDFKYFLYKPYSFWSFLWDSINPKVNGEISIDDIGVIRNFWKAPIYDILDFIRGSKTKS